MPQCHRSTIPGVLAEHWARGLGGAGFGVHYAWRLAVAGTATAHKHTDLELALIRLSDAQAQTETELRRFAKENREAQTRVDAGLDSLRRTQEHTEANLDRHSAETRTNLDRLSTEMRASEKRWEQTREELGSLSRKLGTVVEDIIAPSAVALFRRVSGLEEEPESAVRAKRRHRVTRQKREFDLIAWAGGFMLIVQAKSTLRPEHIAEFVEALRAARDYFPEARDMKILGAMASFQIDESLVTAGERQGLLMLGMSSALLTTLNSPGFKPTEF
jgi:hypothetical protein